MSDLPEQVKSWIGQTVVIDEAEVVVERGLIENFCSAVQDGNPLYWDKTIAQQLAGGLISPPAMMSAYNRPHDWAPGREGKKINRPLELHFMVKDTLQLPRGIVSANEIEFREPVRPGDKLTAEQSLREVSEIKTNKLGTGRSWTIDVTYKRQDGEIVGIETTHFFGYGGEQ